MVVDWIVKSECYIQYQVGKRSITGGASYEILTKYYSLALTLK